MSIENQEPQADEFLNEVNRQIELDRQEEETSKKSRTERPPLHVIRTRYRCLVSSSVFWDSRQAYLDLLQTFLSKEMDGERFCSEFFRLRMKNIQRTNELCDQIENRIQPIPDLHLHHTAKAAGFDSEIGDLFFEVDRYDPEIEDSDWNEIVYSESKLRFVIQEYYFPKLQKLAGS